MDIVDELKAFVATAQSGSFTAAGEQLGVSNRLTSKYVADLESRLGVRLFQRTTRKVGLTPAGADLLARAPAILDDLDDLLAEVGEGSRAFTGTIRVSAPITLGETYVAQMLGRFGELHPGLALDLRLSDRFVDLASEGIDLGFRVGITETMAIKVRKLGDIQTVLAASPGYLAAHGPVRTPDDLIRHACVIDTNLRARRWVFHKDGRDWTAQVTGRFMVNSARAACELAIAGHGIICSPRPALSDALDSGRLVSLLDDYASPRLPITAIYLEGRRLPRKVRALIDFAVEDIKTSGIL